MKRLLLALLLIPSFAFGSPTLFSKSALVINNTTDEVLLNKQMNTTRPVASITKLMTAVITIEANQPLDESLPITIKNIDKTKKTTSRLPINTKYSRQELLLLTLMSSENRAANTLAYNYPTGYNDAIKQMNKRAKELHMMNTTFHDATGLSKRNTSTPHDLYILAKTAHSYPLIHKYTTTKQQEFVINNHNQIFKNTNPLIRLNDTPQEYIQLTKTGYTNEAGRCITMAILTKNNTSIVIVLMNAPSSQKRAKDVKTIITWLDESNI